MKLSPEKQKIWDEAQGTLTKLAARAGELNAPQKAAEDYTAAVESRNKRILDVK